MKLTSILRCASLCAALISAAPLVASEATCPGNGCVPFELDGKGKRTFRFERPTLDAPPGAHARWHPEDPAGGYEVDPGWDDDVSVQVDADDGSATMTIGHQLGSGLVDAANPKSGLDGPGLFRSPCIELRVVWRYQVEVSRFTTKQVVTSDGSTSVVLSESEQVWRTRTIESCITTVCPRCDASHLAD